jgi:hypothetical protein
MSGVCKIEDRDQAAIYARHQAPVKRSELLAESQAVDRPHLMAKSEASLFEATHAGSETWFYGALRATGGVR